MIVAACWLALLVTWLITALRLKRTVQKQRSGSRAFHIATLLAAYLLLFNPNLGVGPLGYRLVPATPSAYAAGAALTAAGALFAIWARIYIGSNWSSRVTLKEDHQLVRSGPYAFVRHPIYSGLLLAMLGTAIAYGVARCFAGVLIAFVSFYSKLRLEESFMLQRFEGEYIDYRARVRALIPFVL